MGTLWDGFVVSILSVITTGLFRPVSQKILRGVGDKGNL